ncbi:stalk domain-containing protein [Bacillus sp. CGMCC 1.16607]|uniref:stalk domain-containing protein n=1 Tax=Bacillus sp. CGMCC 1.16607 TaxID=3351842 RepID=UPI0036351589
MKRRLLFLLTVLLSFSICIPASATVNQQPIVIMDQRTVQFSHEAIIKNNVTYFPLVELFQAAGTTPKKVKDGYEIFKGKSKLGLVSGKTKINASNKSIETINKLEYVALPAFESIVPSEVTAENEDDYITYHITTYNDRIKNQYTTNLKGKVLTKAEAIKGSFFDQITYDQTYTSFRIPGKLPEVEYLITKYTSAKGKRYQDSLFLRGKIIGSTLYGEFQINKSEYLTSAEVSKTAWIPITLPVKDKKVIFNFDIANAQVKKPITPQLILDNKQITFKVAPIFKDKYNMFPLKELFSKLGANVSEMKKGVEYKVSFNGKTVIFYTNKNTYLDVESQSQTEIGDSLSHVAGNPRVILVNNVPMIPVDAIQIFLPVKFAERMEHQAILHSYKNFVQSTITDLNGKILGEDHNEEEYIVTTKRFSDYASSETPDEAELEIIKITVENGASTMERVSVSSIIEGNKARGQIHYSIEEDGQDISASTLSNVLFNVKNRELEVSFDELLRLVNK